MIVLTDEQVQSLHDFDLFDIREQAVDFRKTAMTNDGDPLAWNLRTASENIIAIIDTLPCKEIEPNADWSTITSINQNNDAFQTPGGNDTKPTESK